MNARTIRQITNSGVRKMLGGTKRKLSTSAPESEPNDDDDGSAENSESDQNEEAESEEEINEN